MLVAILSDGRYLAAWPWIAAVGPIAALFVGAVLGAYVVRPGEEFTRYLSL